MLAITIRQPWAYAVIRLGKRVENRGKPDPWRKAIGQRVWIHAGTWKGNAALTEMRDEVQAMAVLARRAGVAPPPLRMVDMDFGGIVGSCQVTGVWRVDACTNDPWACGPWCILLADVRPTPFTPTPYVRGMPRRDGLWEPDAAVVAGLTP